MKQTGENLESLKAEAMSSCSVQSSRGGVLSFLDGACCKAPTSRTAQGLMSIIIGVVALAAVMIPVTKWIVSMSNDTEELSTKLEMQSYIQDYWHKVNAATYDEFQEEISAKGTTWKEDVGGKYELTIKFSADGKYQNAQCYVGTAAGTEDRHCRKAEISIISKENTSLAQGLETTKISTAAESRRLREMEGKIASNASSISLLNTKTSNLDSRLSSLASTVSGHGSSISGLSSSISSLTGKFSDYYTKSEVDSKISSSSSSSSSSGDTSSSCKATYYWVVEDAEGSVSCPGQGGVFKCNWSHIQVGINGFYEGHPSCIREYKCTGGAQGTKSVIWTGTWWGASSAPAECRR